LPHKQKVMELGTKDQIEKPKSNHTISTVQQQKTSGMVISIEKKIEQPSAANVTEDEKHAVGTKQLKALFETVLKEKKELGKYNLNWIDEKTVVTDELSGIALHNFLLKVEELGKNITFTKKTIIEIH